MDSRISFGNSLDRWVLKNCFRASLPLLAIWLIQSRRLLCAPLASLRYRQAKRLNHSAAIFEEGISRQTGYSIFSPDAFPELSQIVTACQEVFSRHEAEITDSGRYNKPYFHNILTVEDLLRHPVLLNFALSTAVTKAVTEYLGQQPRLHSIGVFYSAVNESVAGSQMWHVDGDALSQVKCFVNIWEVMPGGGAFTFLPKSNTSTAFRNKGLLKTVSDEEVEQKFPAASQITATGAPGSGVFTDTSRCLHQGSRSRVAPRLVFQFQYVTRPDALLARSSEREVAGGHLLVTRKLTEQVKYGNPDAAQYVA